MLRLAVPTGDLRSSVAATLAAAGLRSDDYAAGSRALRLALAEREDVALRVFREKDIPIQVALGNYDLGICGAVWVAELQTQFPQEDIVVIRALDFGRQRLVLAAPPATLAELGPATGWASVAGLRIVSEQPALAEHVVRRLRLPRALVFAVWGAAEAYPPEDADLALLRLNEGDELDALGLAPALTLLDSPAWLIANRRSLAQQDISAVLGPLLAAPPPPRPPATPLVPLSLTRPASVRERERPARADLRLAVPDGHAQRHTYQALLRAGLRFDGYEETSYVRRPASGIDGLSIKVIRPQDMPEQVALGNIDLAITGRDWLMDHTWAFPSSPVAEALDLGLSRYGIAAAVSEDVPAGNLADALRWWRSHGVKTIRIASEYPHIADHFARQRHLGRYSIVPVNGASEAFVPEDSEILIEGTETGSSFRANHLKAIDQVMESTNCVIIRTTGLTGGQQALANRLLDQLRASLAVTAAG